VLDIGGKDVPIADVVSVTDKPAATTQA